MCRLSSSNGGLSIHKKTVFVYINTNVAHLPACTANHISRNPEYAVMPIDAVRKIKILVDEFLNSSDKSMSIFTVSSDVVSFVYNYGKKMKYSVKMFYGKKRVGIEKAFEYFNKVFAYSDKLTNLDE